MKDSAKLEKEVEELKARIERLKTAHTDAMELARADLEYWKAKYEEAQAKVQEATAAAVTEGVEVVVPESGVQDENSGLPPAPEPEESRWEPSNLKKTRARKH